MIIYDQSQLDAELSKFPWHDSYIRESHILSPSYTFYDNDGKSWVSLPNSHWGVRILVCHTDIEYPAVEFFFEETKELYVSSELDLNPCGFIDKDGVNISMHGKNFLTIRAKNLHIRYFGREVWGETPHYTIDNLYDEYGFLKKDI